MTNKPAYLKIKETFCTTMEKKKQNQPKHHAAKNKIAVAKRRKKIIKGILDGKTQEQAGIDAGLSPKTAKQQVSEILDNPELHETMCKLLDKAGVTNDFLAQTHYDLLTANKTVSVIGGKDAGSGSVDFVDVPDFNARATALKLAYDVKGLITKKLKGDLNVGGLTVEVVKFGADKATK